MKKAMLTLTMILLVYTGYSCTSLSILLRELLCADHYTISYAAYVKVNTERLQACDTAKPMDMQKIVLVTIKDVPEVHDIIVFSDPQTAVCEKIRILYTNGNIYDVDRCCIYCLFREGLYVLDGIAQTEVTINEY